MAFLSVTYVHPYEKLQIIKEIAAMDYYNEVIRQMSTAEMNSTIAIINIEIESKL